MNLQEICRCDNPVCTEKRANEIQRMKLVDVFKDLEMSAYFIFNAMEGGFDERVSPQRHHGNP